MFIAVALTYTGGLQGTGDTKSPLYISIVSQIIVPLGICFVIQQTGHARADRTSGSRSWSGHATRCALSVLRFNQGKWRGDRGGHRASVAVILKEELSSRRNDCHPERSEGSCVGWQDPSLRSG